MAFPISLSLAAALVLSSSAFAGGTPAAPDLDKLQTQFAATTKELVRNMRLASTYAPQCSFFGSAITNALEAPIQAIPPGAQKVDTSLSAFKTKVAGIGLAPSSGVDISTGSARAVSAKQKQISAAVAEPAAVIDDMSPVVEGGLLKMQQSHAKAMGLLRGDSPACQQGSAAFEKVFAGSVAAEAQLKGIRAALDSRKTALLGWNSGIQATLGANK